MSRIFFPFRFPVISQYVNTNAGFLKIFWGGEYNNTYGGFGVCRPKSYQIWSKSHLMGPVWWKKCSSLMLLMIKFDQMFFFGRLFPPVDKVIENSFVQDLGGITQRCMGYRLGNDRTRPYTYALTTLIHRWDTAPVHRLAWTKRESIIRLSITLAAIACVRCGRPAAASCATQAKQVVSSRGWIGRDGQNVFYLTTTAAISSCSLRARAPCKSKGSLLYKRLALRSSPRGAAFRLID